MDAALALANGSSYCLDASQLTFPRLYLRNTVIPEHSILYYILLCRCAYVILISDPALSVLKSELLLVCVWVSEICVMLQCQLSRISPVDTHILVAVMIIISLDIHTPLSRVVWQLRVTALNSPWQQISACVLTFFLRL